MNKSTDQRRQRSGTVPSRGSTDAEPTLRQRQILDAYFEQPNAAAVGRSTGASERNVRRIVERFAGYLKAKSEARYAERIERELARTSRMQLWLDGTLDDDMRRLDELTKSANENVALQALRMKFGMTGSRLGITAESRPGAGLSAVRDDDLRDMIGGFDAGGSAS